MSSTGIKVAAVDVQKQGSPLKFPKSTLSILPGTVPYENDQALPDHDAQHADPHENSHIRTLEVDGGHFLKLFIMLHPYDT